jgi:predicted metal-dependent phosphoesterase TrpH
MNADLHCHSCHSDGVLAPSALAARAAANGVELWSLTDHDTLSGLEEARFAALECGLSFVDGVEVSVSWGGITVHVVGLGIDPSNADLVAGLTRVRSGRDVRALHIAEELSRLGVVAPYENAMRHAGNPSLVGRSHFARVLVEQGYASDMHAVFRNFLVPGRPGFVDHRWTTLSRAVAWINGADGIAVIAHPGRYRVSGEQVEQLFEEFHALGGRGIEVVSGSHGDAEVRTYARLARRFGFYASRASDFHAPDEGAVDLGRSAPLPDDLLPIWRAPQLSERVSCVT